MDGQRFDQLTRSFATRATRRTIVRGLAGTVGGLLGLAAAARTLGQTCRAGGRTCAGDANCCSGICDTTNADPTKRNRCACPAGQENCRGACRRPEDYLGDPLNCGSCGNRCPVDQCNRATCVQGVCGLEPNPARVGKSCDSGNCCTTGELCQPRGVCAGTPTPCASPDACEEGPGVCNPQSCQCEYRLKSEGVVCREAAGDCDLPAECTGTSPSCPSNPFNDEGTECRASTGPCDPAEECTGSSAGCPPDVVLTPCGQTCCGPGEECSGGTCRACGGVGENCCSTSTEFFCDAGLECLEGFTCGTCGGANEACCQGSICDAGLRCSGIGGTCIPCGGAGDFCCPGPICDAGLECTLQSICAACGSSGEPCCGVQSPSICDPGLGCDFFDSRLCGPCVSEGDPCCLPDFTCGGGLECISFDLTCGVCGGVEQPCCFVGGNIVCDSGLVCDPDRRPTTCVACGGSGEGCCPGPGCDPGLECTALGTCGACGGLNQICCAGPNGFFCDSGLDCDFGSEVCR